MSTFYTRFTERCFSVRLWNYFLGSENFLCICFLLIFNVAFHLVVTNLFIHVVPRLHKVIVNIKSDHNFLIQSNENSKGAFCNLVFHNIVGLILFL